ncbi:peptide ABC transporter substrate-binding protein [Limnochorda pilosa]|uniref:Peptide ABC transporter substrate-binding protein n=1 Tax=Limnochorda pilosa TaxID=1555112 RepID=A0A0K2SJT8_LIMPI|nr:peptide ABC transporter substrate-binding protein [Limnochorda pilosa]
MVWRSLALACALALALAALPTGAASPPDTLVVGMDEDAVTMDPMNFRHRQTETILRNVYDGLVTRTPDMRVVPELAESWEQPDDTTWIFHLRRGVTFHDGTPFTAEDAAYSINRIVRDGAMGGQTSPRKGLLGQVTGAEVVDEYTLKIETDGPWPALLSFLPFHMMVPSETGDRMIEKPVGTGPFRFVEWQKGQRVVLARYDDYYGGSPELPPVGPAQVKRVIFQALPEPASRLAALRAGEIDIMTDVPVDQMGAVEADPNLQVLTVNGTRSFFMGMNVTKPPFDDVRVRRAVNLAVDVQAIVDGVLNGLATRTSTLLSPQAFGFDESLEAYAYDPEAARELLQEAGVGSGLSITVDTMPDNRPAAEVIAYYLEQVGIRTRIQSWGDYGAMVDAIKQGRRDAWVDSWGNATLDPSDIAEPKLRTGGRGNYSGYSNPRVDELLTLAARTTDQEARQDAYREMQAIVHEDAPMLFGWVAQDLYAVNRRIENWEPSPDSRINLHDAQER